MTHHQPAPAEVRAYTGTKANWRRKNPILAANFPKADFDRVCEAAWRQKKNLARFVRDAVMARVKTVEADASARAALSQDQKEDGDGR